MNPTVSDLPESAIKIKNSFFTSLKFRAGMPEIAIISIIKRMRKKIRNTFFYWLKLRSCMFDIILPESAIKIKNTFFYWLNFGHFFR